MEGVPPADLNSTPPEVNTAVPAPESRETGWDAVRTPCLACTACDLHLTRTQVVFGEGNIHSPLVIVGEGPGEQEDATGRPFVGRSGALLEEALRENGILRKHVYITNVLKCRACAVTAGRRLNRSPAPHEIDACHPWLSAELQVVAPLVILCLGGPSASWIIHPEFRITRERGQFFATTWAQFAIASFHPSYVLRQQDRAFQEARATLVRDIAAARQKVIELKRSSAADPALPDPAPGGSESDETQLSLF